MPETPTMTPEELENPKPTSEVQLPESLASEELAAKRTQWMIVGGGIAFLVFLIVVIVLLSSYPKATQVIRDIAIVFVAVETFLIGLAALLLIFQIQVLIQVLRDEIQPLLRSFNDTAATVQGTTEFVSHNVVSPFIKLAGVAAAVRQVTSDVVRIAGAARPRKKSKEPSVPHNPKGEQENVKPG